MMSMIDGQPSVSRSTPSALFVQRPAQPEQARAIRHALTRYLQELGCSADFLDTVTLAVGEAVNNAVSYGWKAVGAEVSLCCRFVAPEVLAVEVRNQGMGFVPDLPAASALPDEFAIHGRGFALMTMLMDEVQVFTEGDETVVRLVKRFAA